MKRRVFNVAAVCSLVVFVAAVTFAIRGRWRADYIGYTGNAVTVMAASTGSSGWFSFWLDAQEGSAGLDAGWTSYDGDYFYALPEELSDWLGFSVYIARTDPSLTSRLGGNRRYGVIVMPHWMLALVAGVLPMWWGMRKVRARRLGEGRCAKCGYDLRASPQRCPECQTEVKQLAA